MTGDERHSFANRDVTREQWEAAKAALQAESDKGTARVLRVEESGPVTVVVELFKVYNDFRFNLMSDERVEARLLFLYHPGFGELTVFLQPPGEEWWTMLTRQIAGAALEGRYQMLRESMRA